MAWIYFQELVESPSPLSPGSEQSPIASATPTHKAFFCPECDQAVLIEHPSGTMCDRCDRLTCPASTLSQAASPARISALQEMERAWKASEADLYLKSSGSLASCDRDSFSWKTFQLSLFGGLTDFSWSSMRWGMMRDGQLFQPSKWEPRTSENESGSFVPTATATDSKSSRNLTVKNRKSQGNPGVTLTDYVTIFPTPTATPYGSNQSPSEGAAVRLSLDAMAKHNRWPTPAARDWKDTGTSPSELERNSPGLAAHAGGQLNPTWVEWLMGFPSEWTVCAAWATPLFRKPRAKRSKGSQDLGVNL